MRLLCFDNDLHGWLLIKIAASVGAPFPGPTGCHDSTCSMGVLSCASRHTPQGPRKPTQQASGVATMTHWPKRGSLSLTEIKAVAPIHRFCVGFVFIVPITSAQGRMAANTSFAQQQCLWGIGTFGHAKTARDEIRRHCAFTTNGPAGSRGSEWQAKAPRF